MYAKQGDLVTLLAGFTNNGAAAPGLTVTCKVWEVRADGSKVPNDTVGTTVAVVEIGGGAYFAQHTMAGAGVPLAVFSTAGTADLKVIQTSALTIIRLDELISTRATPEDVAPAITVNPTPVTVEPTPVTVNPTTLDPAERALIAEAVDSQGVKVTSYAEGAEPVISLTGSAKWVTDGGTFYIKRNDTLPVLDIVLVGDDGVTPLDLSGCAVQFRARLAVPTVVGGAIDPDAGELKVDGAAEIVDALTGRVRYSWAEGDTDTAGRLLGEFELTRADGKFTVPNDGFITVHVTEDLG